MLLDALPRRLVTLQSVLVMLGALWKTLMGLSGASAGSCSSGRALAIIAALATMLTSSAGSAVAPPSMAAANCGSLTPVSSASLVR